MKFSDIREVSPIKGGINIFYKGQGLEPTPQTIKGDNAEMFLKLYREYLSTNKNPEDRIIDGIDNMQDGSYSREAEQSAINKTLTLQENYSYREKSKEIVEYLSQLLKYRQSVENLATGMGQGLKAIHQNIKEVAAEINSPSYPVQEIEDLQEMFDIQKTVKKLSNSTDEIILRIVKRWGLGGEDV